MGWDEATLGIIGMGRIGEEVARRSRYGFKMEFLKKDEPDSTNASENGVKRHD